MTAWEDEVKLVRAETAYEDYVISLIAGKTAEQVDETEFTPEQLAHAGHYIRNVKTLGKLDNPEDFEQNYLEEVVKNGPNAREFEAEMEYRKKYGKDPTPDCSKLYVDRPCRCGEYDGRDDDFIQEMLKCMKDADYPNADNGVQPAPDEEIPPGEAGMRAGLI